MFSWLIRRRLDAFERSFNYDASYAREILDESTDALLTWNRAVALGQWRGGVDRDSWYAARLVALVAEDCGPCTQLLVTMAAREGVDPATIRAILSHGFAALPERVALAARFADAVMRADPLAENLREQVVRQFGRRGLIGLAFGVTASRLYPTLKRALGYAHACTRVVVDGQTIHPARSLQPTERERAA